MWRLEVLTMEFPKRVAQLRKEKGMSQNDFAEAIGVHVSQLRRYEGGTSQPTLDVLKRMTTTLGISADMLLFGTDERGPGEELKLQFDALKQLGEEEQNVVKILLDSLLLRHDAKRWTKTG